MPRFYDLAKCFTGTGLFKLPEVAIILNLILYEEETRVDAR